MKKAKLKVSAVLLGVGILSAQSALATYSSYGTFEVTAGTTQTTTTTGSKLKQMKETNNTTVSFQASSMTMWSDPDARIVNSNNEKRSDWVEVKNTSDTFTAGNNIGEPNYYYYAQVKPDATQSGTDTIKLRFNPK
ncbi:hypothetical protein KUV80_10895 [Fictibacillus nanhaiensis]|uniref:hypothetical protein n=1 Tax=Fictibacillus nanhaiensis TaxID=742169 RepID=UPI001C93721B|nr:hypothetical protein [Fictibacillus nanhaiensis]MBY6037166.1 hypothetical protein [Fictibacillus nanhaiensis]